MCVILLELGSSLFDLQVSIFKLIVLRKHNRIENVGSSTYTEHWLLAGSQGVLVRYCIQRWLDHQWDHWQVGCPDSLFGAVKKTCDVKLFSFWVGNQWIKSSTLKLFFSCSILSVLKRLNNWIGTRMDQWGHFSVLHWQLTFENCLLQNFFLLIDEGSSAAARWIYRDRDSVVSELNTMSPGRAMPWSDR